MINWELKYIFKGNTFRERERIEFHQEKNPIYIVIVMIANFIVFDLKIKNNYHNLVQT